MFVAVYLLLFFVSDFAFFILFFSLKKKSESLKIYKLEKTNYKFLLVVEMIITSIKNIFE
jgi:hypothetical protein